MEFLVRHVHCNLITQYVNQRKIYHKSNIPNILLMCSLWQTMIQIQEHQIKMTEDVMNLWHCKNEDSVFVKPGNGDHWETHVVRLMIGLLEYKSHTTHDTHLIQI